MCGGAGTANQATSRGPQGAQADLQADHPSGGTAQWGLEPGADRRLGEDHGLPRGQPRVDLPAH